MTKKDYEKAAKMLGWGRHERLDVAGSVSFCQGRDAEDFAILFFSNDNRVFDITRFLERVTQWAEWLYMRNVEKRPVYDGEFERTTIGEMQKERKQIERQRSKVTQGKGQLVDVRA